MIAALHNFFEGMGTPISLNFFQNSSYWVIILAARRLSIFFYLKFLPLSFV